MRFLCLHGQGTSSQVLEVQLSAVRYQLGDGHTYEFVEGTVPAKAAPEIQALFPPDGKYFSYFDERSTESCLTALNDIELYLQIEGPFDGLIAFSQGGALASTVLVSQARATSLSNLKLAIFFSGGIPVDPELLKRGIFSPLDNDIVGEAILVPTVHVMGHTERGELEWPAKLLKLCKEEVREQFQHVGGHQIPGTNDREGVTGTVKAIRRAIWKVQKRESA